MDFDGAGAQAMERNRIFRCTRLVGFLSFVLLVAWQVGAQTRSDSDQALIRERIQKIMDETIKAGETVITVDGQKVVAVTFIPPLSDAISEIKNYGDLAVPILAEYLRQDSGFEKYHAMRFLGAIGGESIVVPLSHVALNDPSAGYREYALAFLTQAPWKLAAPILREAAKDDASIRVRQTAKELLEGYAPR